MLIKRHLLTLLGSASITTESGGKVQHPALKMLPNISLQIKHLQSALRVRKKTTYSWSRRKSAFVEVWLPLGK